MKTKILLVISIFIVFMFTSCRDNEDAEVKDKRFGISHEGLYSRVIYDTETGVEYYYRSETGITPLYNADGTLKVYDGARGK